MYFFDDVSPVHTPSPIVAVSDYFPYGLQYNAGEKTGGLEQKILYNSKELQDELSLNWYDYGARMYMADIGRWGVIDPLSEVSIRWTPYNYGYNNPIRFVDPSGMLSLDHETERNKGTNKEDPDMGKSHRRFTDSNRQCICNSSNGGSSNGPKDDYRLNKDGTISLIKQTDDKFHRYYNEDNELIWQTNWTKEDVGSQIAASESNTPANDFMGNLYTLLRALGDKDLNGYIVASMFKRARDVGWDSYEITKLIAESQTAYNKDMGDFAKSFLDVKSLGRGSVPITEPISQGFKFFTGQPISNFGPWFLRKLVEGESFDWNKSNHLDRLDKR